MKKIVALVLCVVLVFSLSSVAFAYDTSFGSKSYTAPVSSYCSPVVGGVGLVGGLVKGVANTAALISAVHNDHVGDIVDAAVSVGSSLLLGDKAGDQLGDVVGAVVEGAMAIDDIKAATVMNFITGGGVMIPVPGIVPSTVPSVVPGSSSGTPCTPSLPGTVPGKGTSSGSCPSPAAFIGGLVGCPTSPESWMGMAGKDIPGFPGSFPGYSGKLPSGVSNIVSEVIEAHQDPFMQFLRYLFPTVPQTPVKPTPTPTHTSTTTTSTLTSPQTFDPGIALYVGLAVMGTTGGAFLIGKKKEF